MANDAIFSVGPEGLMGSNVSPTQPSQDTSGVVTLQAVGGIFEGLAKGYGRAATQAAEDRAKLAKGSVLTEATNKLSKLADQVNTQNMDSSTATTLARSMLRKYKSANPIYAEELDKAYNSFISGPLGKDIQEGSEQFQMEDALINKARDAGWIKSYYTREQQVQAANMYANFQMTGDQLDRQAKMVDLQNSQLETVIKNQTIDRNQVTMAKAQIDLNNARLAKDTRSSLSTFGEVYFNGKFKQDVDSVMRELNPEDPQSVSQAMQAMDQLLWQVKASVTSGTNSYAGSDFISAQLKPFEDYVDITKRKVNGEYTDQQYKAKSDRIVLLQKYAALQDPEMVRAVVVNDMLKYASPNILASNKAAANYLNLGAMPKVYTPADKTERRETSEFLSGVVTPSIQALVSDSVDKDTGKILSEQVNAQINDVLKSLSYHSMSVENPSQYDAVSSFLASPEYTKYVEKYGRNLQYSDSARNVLEVGYQNKLIEGSRDMYENAKVQIHRGRGVTEKSLKEVFEPKFTGNSVTFVTKKGVIPSPEVAKKLSEINSEQGLAGAVNRMLNLNYNLSGEDKKTTWETVIAPNIFDISFEEPKDGN